MSTDVRPCVMPCLTVCHHIFTLSGQTGNRYQPAPAAALPPASRHQGPRTPLPLHVQLCVATPCPRNRNGGCLFRHRSPQQGARAFAPTGPGQSHTRKPKTGHAVHDPHRCGRRDASVLHRPSSQPSETAGSYVHEEMDWATIIGTAFWISCN